MQGIGAALFRDKRTTILWLRWLLIVALSYLVLFHTGQLVLSWKVSSIILLYILSNFALIAAPPRLFGKPGFDLALVAGDSVIITAAMVVTGFSSSNLLLFYFLIILLTTLGKSSGAIVGNGLIMVGVYLVFLLQSQGLQVVENSGLLLHIPFLIICTVFYSVMVDQEHSKQRHVLEQIKAVSVMVASSLNLRAIYQTTLDAMVNLLGADTCSIMLLEPDRKTLTLQDARGLDPKMIGEARQQVGEGIAGRIVEEGLPMLMNDFPFISAPRSAYSKKQIVSSVGVPLKVKEQVIGVLNMASLNRRRRFRQQDLDLLTHFAAQIASSIESARLFDQLKGKNAEIKEANMEVIQALAEAVESKDLYTGGHARRLAIYADAIAHKAGFPAVEIENLWYAAILHDVGKIGVPDAILHCTGRLSSEQWEVMKGHSEKGAAMLSQIRSLAHITPFIRHHHERWDGKGYPQGLRRQAIPLFSRIISIADTFDAVTTNRSYQKGISAWEAMDLLKRCAGQQLDPDMVELFLSALAESESLRGLCLDSSGNIITRK